MRFAMTFLLSIQLTGRVPRCRAHALVRLGHAGVCLKALATHRRSHGISA
jgi:hypothetical protein